MVVDWDVHHGNSTQHQVWHDERVLYASIHRFDDGAFFPQAPCADLDRTGPAGLNLNVPLSLPNGEWAGDESYVFAFERLVLPLGRAFRPDLVLVSAGFDSADGDPLGGWGDDKRGVSPAGYAHLTRQLQSLGPVVLALEGGYNLDSIASSGAACVRALLGEEIRELELRAVPKAVVKVVEDARWVHEHFSLIAGGSGSGGGGGADLS